VVSHENSVEPSRITSAARATAGRDHINDLSGEHSQHQQSTFKSYLPPPSNAKTDKELKSEEFNRKQIIISAREYI
jgi:hypothetical protein